VLSRIVEELVEAVRIGAVANLLQVPPVCRAAFIALSEIDRRRS
jgi:hypothetical protein